MNVICLQEEAFYALLGEVLAYARKNFKKEDSWIPAAEAMQLLGIKSKSTLQKLRDEGSIRFSQPQKKLIMYDRESINKFLNKHAKDTF